MHYYSFNAVKIILFFAVFSVFAQSSRYDAIAFLISLDAKLNPDALKNFSEKRISNRIKKKRVLCYDLTNVQFLLMNEMFLWFE